MTLICNFFGGPGAGKSTISAQLFGWMKEKRLNCEYVPEFAKDLTWKKDMMSLDDQLYVLGQQHNRIYTLINQVDYIVTDSPLLLQLHYLEQGFSKLDRQKDIKYLLQTLIPALHHSLESKNFLVDRGNRKFLQAGRNQDESESRVIDEAIRQTLNNQCVSYYKVSNLEQVISLL